MGKDYIFIWAIYKRVDNSIVEMFYSEEACSFEFDIYYDKIYPGEYDWRAFNIKFLINDYLNENYPTEKNCLTT